MFTGLVQAIGTIEHCEEHGADCRMHVVAQTFDLGDIAVGDSISVSGVCLTAVLVDGARFAADISVETLSRTTLGTMRAGARVNLEKSLRLADRLGGHLVSGHVDGVGTVIAVAADARSERWTFEAPAELSRYIAEKGSICVDGVSLTVNGVAGNRFEVNLIPHTLKATTFAYKRGGDAVNLEVDMVARYLERLHHLER
jgi:riboflavin synthase